MKKFECDICQQSVGEYDLTQLYDYYQIQDVKDVCKTCLGEISEVVSRIEKALEGVKSGWVRRTITRLVMRDRLGKFGRQIELKA